METINQDLGNIELKMYHQGNKIYSGPVKDRPEFSSAEQPVDQCKFFNAQGVSVMSMCYQEFEKIISG